MYFKQISEIISGKKTQTRRIVKPGEYLTLRGNGCYISHAVMTLSQRLKWWVFWDYAVCPGRGKPAVWWNPEYPDQWKYGTAFDKALPDGQRLVIPVEDRLRAGWQPLRIKITAIRQEYLNEITEADAKAEGVEPSLRYDIDHLEGFDSYVAGYEQLWDKINGKTKGARWRDNPRVWVLTFEVA
jgi:hypothetical protein